MQFGIYAEGLESLVGEGGEEAEEESESDSSDSEAAPEVEPTAGMTFTLMDVLLRQIEFFRGSTGLMSAVWNAPSDLTSALQVNQMSHAWFKTVALSLSLALPKATLGKLLRDGVEGIWAFLST